MTGLGVQQTNRRMCRYVFVMFIFLCRPQDVYVQGLPSVSCEAGEVTVEQRATITCIFPNGSITPGNSNFVVKKFTDINPRDGTDIMDCFHVAGSTSDIPKCIFSDTSLGYNFTFVPGNDRQTVVIPSAKHSDAGEYGCDRIGHVVAKCTLTVKEMTTTAAPVTTTTSDRNAISTDEDYSDADLSPGAIIGIVIGILVGVGLLGGAACFVWRFKFRKLTFEEVTGRPLLWLKRPTEHNIRVPLSPGDPEYRAVEDRFNTSWQGGSFRIINIERIQNPTLWCQYVEKRIDLDTQNQGGNNERTLWHCTLETNIHNINLNGFSNGYCDENGMLYGDGIYFTVGLGIANQPQYSPPDAQGLRYVYQSKVLVGRFIEDKRGMTAPPVRDRPNLSNSPVDEQPEPSVFIIFNKRQAYPEYLVAFEEGSETANCGGYQKQTNQRIEL